MPKADATELAPKKSAAEPSHVPDRAWEGLSFRTEKQRAHFFGEAPERRPWAIKRERSPGRFCRALLLPFQRWDTASAYMGEYPIPIPKMLLSRSGGST